MLPVITVVVVGALGGAVAVGVTTLVIIAAAVLVLLATTNGLRHARRVLVGSRATDGRDAAGTAGTPNYREGA